MVIHCYQLSNFQIKHIYQTQIDLWENFYNIAYLSLANISWIFTKASTIVKLIQGLNTVNNDTATCCL